MNRDDFLNVLFGMYENSFPEGNRDFWKEAYKKVLPEDLDFQALFDWMLVNYQNTKVAPGTGFFTGFVKKHKQDKEEERKYKEQVESQRAWQNLQEEIQKSDNVDVVSFELIEPLELLKQVYGDEKYFINSMAERQSQHFHKKPFIRFTKEEIATFRQYVDNLPTANRQRLFWMKVMRLIGREDKYYELCGNM